MTEVGFEPMQLALVQLESPPFRPLGQTVFETMFNAMFSSFMFHTCQIRVLLVFSSCSSFLNCLEIPGHTLSPTIAKS